MQLITSPEKFADFFNAKVPGAHRQITVDDVRDMVTCGLIGKFSCFLDLDLETVRDVLQYEQLRQNRQKRDEIRDSDGVIHCRRCGVLLVKAKTRRGRPREYCPRCESS
jgi:formamidopyrimidine-DNA glycosylase